MKLLITLIGVSILTTGCYKEEKIVVGPKGIAGPQGPIGLKGTDGTNGKNCEIEELEKSYIITCATSKIEISKCVLI